jgi:hypothetical protein
MKAVQFLIDVPQTECWLILQNISTPHEGDARSMKHPGHGYPEHTDHTVRVVVVCATEAEFLDALGALIRESRNDGTYRGFKVQPYFANLIAEFRIVNHAATCPDCESMVSGRCLQHREPSKHDQ